MPDIKKGENMDDYNQYIQIDENKNIVAAFTSAQEENFPEANKINIGKGLRQFSFQKELQKGIRDISSGQFNYKWNSKNKKIEEIPEDTASKIEKQKEAELQELRRQAKEEILDRFLSEEKSFAEIAEEVRMEMRKKEKEVN